MVKILYFRQGTLAGNPKGNPRTPDRGLVRH